MDLKCLPKVAILRVHLSQGELTRGPVCGTRKSLCYPEGTEGGAQPGDLTTLRSKHKVLDTEPSGLLLPAE